ncbi:MAG: T9SS type A sorting domain-containing protein [Bacteroidetes bacterium]|nr:T9SS type A sorting domain-containing protein [Bacteroidota bacterium]
MKKTLLSISSFLFCASAFAQISNPGFETWVNNNESPHTYLVPQGWITTDVIQSYFNNLFGNPTYVVNTTAQTTNSHSGTYAVQMSVAVSNAGDTVMGAVISDPSATNVVNVALGGGGAMGYAFNQRPANLTGFRKLAIAGGDSAAVAVIFTKWNSVTGTRDTIVNLQNYYFGTAAAAWTSFSIPLPYLSGLTPDTAVIFAGVYSTNTAGHVGTVFTIDDLAFTGVAGVEEQTANSSVNIFPNPFSDQTTFHFNDMQLKNATLIIYDATGNKVREVEQLNGDTFVMDREGLAGGMYFYNITSENAVIAKGKLSVE